MSRILLHICLLLHNLQPNSDSFQIMHIHEVQYFYAYATIKIHVAYDFSQPCSIITFYLLCVPGSA